MITGSARRLLLILGPQVRSDSRVCAVQRRRKCRELRGPATKVPKMRPWLSHATRLRHVFGYLCVAASLLVPASAQANAPITSFIVTPSTSQAGGHPNLRTLFSVENREFQHNPRPNCDCQDPKTVTINYPPGLVGDPRALPQCPEAEFADLTCPIDSQVGTADVGVGKSVPGEEGVLTEYELKYYPVYNLVPHPGEAGLLGYNIPLLDFPAFIVISPRTESDYGLKTVVENIPHLPPVAWAEVNLWGVPASPSNDKERLGPVGCSPRGEIEPTTGPQCKGGNPSNSPLTPLLDNPTSCGVPLSATIEVLAYDEGISRAQTSWPATTGCDQLSFNPSLFAQPTTVAADSPSGLVADLQLPQGVSATTPSPSEIRETTVTLPEGFSINPNAADGKTACSDLDARFGTEEEAECPETSKVGSLTIESAALPGPLPGYVYLGEPRQGNRYRIFLVANGFDVHIKLAGTVTPNPKTGQLTVSFSELPQSPFSELDIHIFGSERGLLATPTQCGIYPVTSTFKPWDSFLPEQTSTQFFELKSGPITAESGPGGAPCPGPTRPFNPGFQASSVNSVPGAHTPFFFDLTRSDGDQNLSGLTLTTPPGFSATLAGIPYCSDHSLEEAADPSYGGLQEEVSPSCPQASQIGTATIGAGAGDHPVYVSGKVYLAGPYKGAPLSVAVITPAVSGPYDLGNAVVRAALHVNPETAQITAVSDPLPQILEGVPLRLRSILLELNRPDFALNPTNCGRFSVGAQIGGNQGGKASRSSLLPGGRLCLPSLRPQARPQALRFNQARRHPRSHRDPHCTTGRSQHRRHDRNPASHRAARQRPRPESLHKDCLQRRKQPRGKVPRGLGHRLREGSNPAARKTPRRPGLPARSS